MKTNIDISIIEAILLFCMEQPEVDETIEAFNKHTSHELDLLKPIMSYVELLYNTSHRSKKEKYITVSRLLMQYKDAIAENTVEQFKKLLI